MTASTVLLSLLAIAIIIRFTYIGVRSWQAGTRIKRENAALEADLAAIAKE